MSKNGSGNIVSGIGWSFGERLLAQGITFLVSIILARIQLPEDYGIVSLVVVFINLANVFVVNGFGEALIQQKTVDEADFSTVFWCTFGLSCILYLLIFAIAPFVGGFYGNEQVVAVLRVLGLKVPLSSINTIQHAYISRKMQFKKLFFSTFGGAVVSGIVGVTMALYGFGVWAIVVQYLVNSALETMVLLFIVKWRPRFCFKCRSARTMINFAWKATGAAFVNALYIEIRSLIIGKVYTSTDLAYYNRGNQIPSLLITNLNTAINKVFFPVMSQLQDEREKLKILAKKALCISSYCVFPVLFGLIGTSRNLVIVLLTDKWLPCVPYLQILSIFWLTQPLQALNWQLLKSVGRSDLCLKLEVIKKALGFTLILSTMYISVKALAYSTMVFGFFSMIINMIPNRKLVSYSISDQTKDIFPSFLISMFMGIAVWGLGEILPFSALCRLLLQLVFGVISYITLSVLLRVKGFQYLCGYLKPVVNRLKVRPVDSIQ